MCSCAGVTIDQRMIKNHPIVFRSTARHRCHRRQTLHRAYEVYAISQYLRTEKFVTSIHITITVVGSDQFKKGDSTHDC